MSFEVRDDFLSCRGCKEDICLICLIVKVIRYATGAIFCQPPTYNPRCRTWPTEEKPTNPTDSGRRPNKSHQIYDFSMESIEPSIFLFEVLSMFQTFVPGLRSRKAGILQNKTSKR